MRPTTGTRGKEQRGKDAAPYRRGVTLGKAMRRGKLDKGERADAPRVGKVGAGSAVQGAKGKGKAPARMQEDEGEGEDGDAASEEEWNGVQASSVAEEDSGDDEPVQKAPAQDKGKRPVPRKAGGTGKKQKVFVEAKSDLVSLAASIVGQAETKKREQLDRVKNKPAAPLKTDRKEPSEAKQRQLAAARAVVAARSKANKDKKKAAATPKPAAPAPAGGKKSVSFA
ncbi:hypothetical protein JCM10450v2_002124 [Rhodotorula kratochvilovae]